VIPARHPRAAAVAALLATCALARPAAADPLPVTLASHAGRVAATVDLAPVLPPDLPEQLGNGLRNVVAIFVAVVPLDRREPTAGFARVIEVLYDVWEETWAVTIRDPQSPSGRRQAVRDLAELRKLLAHGADADLGPAASLPSAQFAIEVRIDVNPVSPELLARTREYLAGAAVRGGTSRSVLGTVAGFLLREPDDDAEILHFRSGALSADAVVPR